MKSTGRRILICCHRLGVGPRTGRCWLATEHGSTETLDTMFRVSVACEGIPPHGWSSAFADVKSEFSKRWWHHFVHCSWEGDALILVVDNEYDNNGAAVADEFSDTVAAYAPGTPGYRVRVLSVLTSSDV
jgi:hypothetical protein